MSESECTYWYRWCRSVVCLSVCRVCAQWLAQTGLKFVSHRSSTSSPNFLPKWPTPFIWASVAAEWLEIVQWSQWRAYRKPPLLFQMVPSLTPYNLLFPQKLSPKCTQDKLSDACCHLVNMTEDIDKAAVCYARCHYELSDVTFCQIILALVLLGWKCSIGSLQLLGVSNFKILS